MIARPTTVYNQRQSEAFYADTTLDVIECICGMTFAIPRTLHQSALEHRGPDGWQISCPLGHTFHYTGKTDAEKLKAARDDLARERARLDQMQASLRGTKMNAARTRKELKTLKQRVAHGVCPCCNRTFKQLASHMKRQHPEYVA